jgi:flagellar motor switch/type III secretory pathway protein FliN
MTDFETPIEEPVAPEPIATDPVAAEPVARDRFAEEPAEEFVAQEPVADEFVAAGQIDEEFVAAEPDDETLPATEQQEPDQPVLADADPATQSVAVHDIIVRVGAELGRATLPLAKAVGLGPGTVIELDRAADDPIDLYVNGRRFATGQLLLVDQTDWAIRIEHVLEMEVNPTDFVGISTHIAAEDLI